MIAVRPGVGGGIELRLGRQEASLLADLASQYLRLLEARDSAPALSPDPAIARLFPAAYADPAAAARFREEGETAALAQRLADAQRLAAIGAGRTRFDREEATAFMRALNGLRLVVATRLGLYTEEDAQALAGSHAPLARIHAWLGLFLERVVAALSES